MSLTRSSLAATLVAATFTFVASSPEVRAQSPAFTLSSPDLPGNVIPAKFILNGFGCGGGNTFMQPTSLTSTNGLNLTAPLVIAGAAKSKFIVNATGKVGDDGVSCGMNPPTFGFQKLP